MLHDTPGKQENTPILPVGKTDFKGEGSQQERKTSDIVQLYSEDYTVILGDSSVATGETVVFGVTLSADSGAAIFPIFEATIWEGQSFSPEHVLWPYYSTSSVTQSNWLIGAAGYSFTTIDDPSIYHNQSAVAWAFTVTNNSGSTLSLRAKVRVRYILNRG